MRSPIRVFTVDILEIDVSSGGEERFAARGAPDDVRLHGPSDLDDPLVQRALPPDRLRLVPERRRRGDVCTLVLVGDEPAGWVWLARVSHRDPWSGLRVRLAPDEIYCYDLWIEPAYRRAHAGLHLALATLREAARDSALNRLYCWVDRDNTPSQRLIRDVLGLQDVQTVRYARVLKRLGVRVPLSDRPRFGPFSRRGRHRVASPRRER